MGPSSKTFKCQPPLLPQAIVEQSMRQKIAELEARSNAVFLLLFCQKLRCVLA